MNKKILYFLFAAIAAFTLTCCDSIGGGKLATVQMERPAWYNENPMSIDPVCSAGCDPIRLSFYGWGLDEDSVVTINFPEQTAECNRAILTYRMGGWNQGPSDWDMTTMIMVKDKNTGEFYEIARAFTPYGGSFGADWEKIYYLDVTEYIPMLKGETEFHIYYGGWDATDKKAHTATLTFNFYKEDGAPNTIYYAKIYDSRASSNTGYRHWAYGVEASDIEAPERLGIRNITVPKEVKELVMKVSISGHGHDQGKFIDRENYRTRNAAEFDRNTYEVVINNVNKGTGEIFYDNGDTYKQAGTYKYDRANWGPGLPLSVHWWSIKNIPNDGNVSIDLNLERFVSQHNSKEDALKQEGLASYIIEVDVFGLDKKLK